MRNAFNQAVKWELMTRNPVEHATLPKEEHKTRDIWTAEVLQKALEACDDDILRLAINLAFSCSLRMGELLGLTWDCIDISPTSIELGQASIFVEKELQRVIVKRWQIWTVRTSCSSSHRPSPVRIPHWFSKLLRPKQVSARCSYRKP